MRKSLFRAVSLNITSQVANAVGALILTAIVSRSLGPSETGNFSLATFAVFTVGSLATLGGPLIITRAVAEEVNREEPVGFRALRRLAARWMIASIVASLGAGLALVAAGLADRYSTAEQLAALACLVAYVLNAYATCLLAGRQDFRRLLTMSSAGTFLQFGLAAAALALGPSTARYLMASALGTLLPGLGIWWLTRSWTGSARVVRPGVRRALRRDALVVSGISVLDTIVLQRTEMFVLAAASTSRQVAFFSLASALVVRTMAFLPGAIAAALLPRFSASDDLGIEYNVSLRWSTLASVPVAGWFVACGPLIVGLLYGPAFRPMASVVTIVAVGAIVNSLGAVAGSATYATHNHRTILSVQGVCAALNAVLAVVLCGPYGAIGAASAGCIAQTCGVVAGFWILARRGWASARWMPIVRAIMAGLFATLLALAIKWALGASLGAVGGLIVVSASFGVGFAVLVVASKALPADEAAVLLRPIRRTISVLETARS